MARKLSWIARRGCFLLAAVGGSLAVQRTEAEGEVQVSSPPTVMRNPFASHGTPAEIVPEEPVPPRRGPVTYHNPFAAMPTSPPSEMPVRPGPVSRWRRPAPPLAAQSPVRAAILSTDPIEHSQIPWDQLPPAESLRERGGTRGSPSNASTATHFADPPDPIRFAPQPLTQPAWLTSDGETIRPLAPSGQFAFSQPLARDPFDVPGGAMAISAPRANAATATFGASPGASVEGTTADADLLPLVISDYADSPEGWLAQAQQIAQTAQTIEELSAIATLCQRGLGGAPSAEIASSLRRLAAWAHNRRGELLIDEDRKPEAIRDFQVAIALDPKCSLAVHNRAVTLAQQNELAAALRDFNRVIELNPGLAVAYRNRAELLASLGRMNEAAADYSRAIEGLPHDAELYRARGYAWHRLGDFEHALSDLNRSVELAPNQPDAFAQRGNLSAEGGNFEQALDDLQRALAIDPNCAEAYRSLAWLQATCANPRYRNAEQALAAAEQAAKLSPLNDSFVLDALAAAHANAGQFGRAAQIQEQAIRTAPADFAEPLRQRLALYQQGQPYRSGPAPAERAASHELESSPTSPPLRLR